MVTIQPTNLYHKRYNLPGVVSDPFHFPLPLFDIKKSLINYRLQCAVIAACHVYDQFQVEPTF